MVPMHMLPLSVQPVAGTKSSILVTTIALDLSSAGIAAECSISMRGNNTIF